MLHFSNSDYTFNKRNLIKSAVPKMFETDDITLKVLTPKKPIFRSIFQKALNSHQRHFKPKGQE